MNPNYGKYIKCFITILFLWLGIVFPVSAQIKTVSKIGTSVGRTSGIEGILQRTSKQFGSTNARIVAGSHSSITMTSPVVSDLGNRHPLPRVDIHPVPTVPTNPPIIPPAYEIVPNLPLRHDPIDVTPSQNEAESTIDDVPIESDEWFKLFIQIQIDEKRIELEKEIDQQKILRRIEDSYKKLFKKGMNFNFQMEIDDVSFIFIYAYENKLDAA